MPRKTKIKSDKTNKKQPLVKISVNNPNQPNNPKRIVPPKTPKLFTRQSKHNNCQSKSTKPKPNKMKKTMLVAALAALAIGSASAETIFITGSTAFRAAANCAIDAYVNAQNGSNTLGSCVQATTAAAINGSASTLGGATAVLWRLTNGNYISAYWFGSEAGVQSIAGPITATSSNAAVTNTILYTNAVKPTVATIAQGVAGTPVTVYTNTPVATYVVGSTSTKQTNGGVVSTIWTVTQTTIAATGTQPAVLPFLSTNASGVAISTTGVTIGAAYAGTLSGNWTQAVAHVAFADNYQSSSAFSAGARVAFNLCSNNICTNPITNTVINSYISALSDYQVAAIGFSWLATPGSGIVSLSKTQAAHLLTNGAINAYELNGRLSDTNAIFVAVGRNTDSGTRVNAMAQSGLGYSPGLNTTNGTVTNTAKQWLVIDTNTTYTMFDGVSVITNTSTTKALVTPYPAEVVDGILDATGTGGRASGGDVCSKMIAVPANRLPTNSVGGSTYVIGYAGWNDAVAKGVNTGLLTPVAYTGTGTKPFQCDNESIKSGNYPFFTIEHLLVAPSASSVAQSAAATIASNLRALSTATLQSTYGLYGVVGFGDSTTGVVSASNLDGYNITQCISRAAGVDAGTVTKVSGGPAATAAASTTLINY